MTRSRKAKAPALVRGGFAKTVSSALTDPRHSTGLNGGRKLGMYDACPVCNTRRYLGKSLLLMLGGSTVRGDVCDSCHDGALLSAGYGASVAHRLAQCQQYKGASYG